jgi:excinuclease ABC subunit A
MAGTISIKGARVHNLKNIDLEIPRDQLVVITGVSGSGKSSLAFDTLYAEGQRRYLESLGADARQLLKQMAKPEVDLISGLSPAIAIEQNAGFASPRSTVGTITDIYDLLRLLFARVGQPFCLNCGSEIAARTIDQVVDGLMLQPSETRIVVLAPVELPGGKDAAKTLLELARQGFTRVMIAGNLHELSEQLPGELQNASRVDLVIDRLILRAGSEKRLADSLELAAKAGQQMVKVAITSADQSAPPRELIFSFNLRCTRCGGGAAPEVTANLFSFNSPRGACPRCKGLGSLARRGKALGEKTPCPECGGTRLNKAALSVRLDGKNIAELAARSIVELEQFLTSFAPADQSKAVAQKIVFEIESRLSYLTRLGVDYLTLDRESTTLSGGEAQRVRLATQIGSGLAGVLYILDEPSIGLHQKDNALLIELLRQLRDRGNSVVVVEHDAETIKAADFVVDMGPGAGIHGGDVVAYGTSEQLAGDPRSLTGRYLSGNKSVPMPERRRRRTGVLRASGISARNLKNLTVEIPIGALTCVTGVSGAGKSTLVMEVLFDGVAQRLRRGGRSNNTMQITGWELFDRVIGIDQSPIGRSLRSNPGTYVGLYDHLRELFAQLPEARVRGYGSERFSFNLPGGRCEACQGDGVVRVEMQFLPDLFVTCEVCRGTRYNRETLDIKYKGLNVADVLDLTVDQASELFSGIAPIYDRLRTLREVGLGYLRLGQAASTLSGGEAQRVKLARELARKSTGRSLYVLDEPTTGLHFDDVKKLLDLLNSLVDQGNTMIIVEHNLDVIKCADYVLDLGPGGGAAGGRLIASGPPEAIAATKESATGNYLRDVLSGTLVKPD